jgi:hypothetical protein
MERESEISKATSQKEE